MNGQPGYIYLIKAGEHYKIGKSTDAARRMRQLSAPMPTQLLHTIPVPDMNRAERYLHRRFAAQRGHGEWFTLSPDDIAWICSLETVEPEPEPEPAPLAAVAPISDLDELLYTAGEAAKYLGVSRQRIYELAQAKRMGKEIVGGWIFRKSDLDRYKAERDSKIYAATLTPVVAV